eukprot:TRINITY_DN30979_c0_g1_i1.p1 TRINITY_DN30979_c0_g1~~TRINITY_DN30979_c0_g1_i1.p1  ORF type:complete len:372 (+),score=46.66 TRINITY_DN30979_c0_g1_i1:75-1190(+)
MAQSSDCAALPLMVLQVAAFSSSKNEDAWHAVPNSTGPAIGWHVKHIEVSATLFKDQGWGNAKSRLAIALCDAGESVVARCDLFGVVRSSSYKHGRSPSRTIGSDELVVALAEPGFHYRLEYFVGGGGGHKLEVAGWRCAVFAAELPVLEALATANAVATDVASAVEHASNAAVSGDTDGADTCAVCLEEEPGVNMPCCGRVGSTIRYCRGCIELICKQGEGTGICPGCRQYISVDAFGVVSKVEHRAKCQMCNQLRLIVGRGICDACTLGSRFMLRYECDGGCGRPQRIPHPMWRYQAIPTEFGTTTWACQRCKAYTHWRVLPEDLPKVPDFDCPESWARREHWLASVRRHRQAERSEGARSAPSGTGGV